MRVLFVSSPGLGHINPMLPLANALRGRGHEVRWAVAPDFVPALEAAGFVASAAGYSERERWREVRRAVGAEDGDGPPEGFGGPDGFRVVFGRVGAPRMARDLEDVVAGWMPDLFVHDMSELASAPVATAHGVKHVTHSWAWALPPATYLGAGEETAHLWTERGLEARQDAGVFQHLFLHPYPVGLVAGPRPQANLQPIRPASVGAVDKSALPAWVGELGEGAIYVTLGTIFNQPGPMRGIVGALAGLGRPLVATLGPRIPADALGDVPDNVHVAAYIPQEAILPHCALVVSHAGAGTFLGAAAHGIPQVCLPMGADQFLNAQVAVSSGMGLMVPPDQRRPADILAAATSVLGDISFRARAREVAAEIAGMPSAEDVAPMIEELAATPMLT